MFSTSALVAFATLAAVVSAQQVGNLTTETHPKMSWQQCSAGGSCTTQSSGAVVLDSNWRWLHHKANYTNCYDGNEWDTTFCPDPEKCAANCALDGAEYTATYGITTSGNALTLKFVTEGQYSTNIGSRVYLMESDTKYKMFNLLNSEFTFDVDLTNIGCGLNGALYFVEMDADGGLSKFSTNKAGAKYGTGYCDAQCPHDIKFINGKANTDGWNPSDNDKNAGSGKYGTCCAEMDIWEANNMATAYTPHPCTVKGQTQCEGSDCGDADERYQSVCDKDGCDFNSYRMGDIAYWGKGKTVDSNKKMTVVTQFITSNNSSSGTLTEIRRIYVQGGKVFENSQATFPGVEGNSITEKFCEAQKTVFQDENQFKAKGGLARMGESMKNGMVLVMSIWDDHAAEMLWLDGSYPLDKPVDQPGIKRGECAQDSGKPETVESKAPKSSVTFSNIKFGPIGSTYKA